LVKSGLAAQPISLGWNLWKHCLAEEHNRQL
jgi:hypothetical protein